MPKASERLHHVRVWLGIRRPDGGSPLFNRCAEWTRRHGQRGFGVALGRADQRQYSLAQVRSICTRCTFQDVLIAASRWAGTGFSSFPASKIAKAVVFLCGSISAHANAGAIRFAPAWRVGRRAGTAACRGDNTRWPAGAPLLETRAGCSHFNQESKGDCPCREMILP